MNYDKIYFMNYVIDVCTEMDNRKIKYQTKYFSEICDFCNEYGGCGAYVYPEHNQRYFIQCYYNLQEKADRGIITKDEWHEIEGAYYKYFGGDY